MKKVLYIIPGFGEKTSFSGYKKIRKIAESKGYKVIPVDLQWDYRTMTFWIDTAREKILKTYTTDSSILGFSAGAFVALFLSQELKFKKSLICSLSTPFFKENLKHLSKSSKEWLGKRRFEDLKKYSFPKQIPSNTIFFQGTKEWNKAQEWLLDQSPKIKLKKLVDVEHNINNKKYISAIEKEL